MIHKEKVCNYKSEEIFLFTLRNNNGIEVKRKYAPPIDYLEAVDKLYF